METKPDSKVESARCMRRPPGVFLYAVAAVALLAAGRPAVSQAAANLSLVPGEVLYYSPSSSGKYTADPEIVVLTNGWYLMCHTTFGNSDGYLRLYKSTNKGTNWTSLVSFPNASAGHSFFLHNDELYLMGGEVILKSTNNGTGWTPAYSKTSFIVGETANYSSWTPDNPVVLSNRIWSAANLRMQSAPVDSNLLNGASWKWSSQINDDPNWFGGEWLSWAESQIVASPELGVFIMPKVQRLPYAGLIRADLATGGASFDTNNFVCLPGGEKKFGATYDPVSGKFFILCNPVLQADVPHILASDVADLNPGLARNTAAVFTSRDLFNWKAEKIFLYTPNIDYEAFQYFNFDFDGETMAIAARTAFDVGDGSRPPRGHDSNLITFHKLDNFRNLTPNHVLRLSGGIISRYEKTQHADAPLGKFALGSTFAGAALTNPNGMGKAASGDIYIRETAGRILHFDAAGNFIETNSSAPVTFQTSDLTVAQPPDGGCTWVTPGAGNWSEPTNWYYWGRPDTTEEIATFGSAATAASTITVESKTQTWNFNTAGDDEGWYIWPATNSIIVTNGALQGTSATNGLLLSLSDRFFYGSTVPEVRVRMKADANCTVYFDWATSVADAFNTSLRRISLAYTGNGAYQDMVFPLAGNARWDGQAITRIRIGPQVHTNDTRGFAIDSITVPRESYRTKGLRFRSTKPYTLSGGGQLRIEADSGSGVIDVLQGGHTNNVELILGSDTEMFLTNGASLHLKLGVNLNGKTLHVSGKGKLLMQDSLVMNGGTIVLNGESPLTFTNNSNGAVLDGTLQFLPDGTFSPTNGYTMTLLDNETVLGTKRFAAVSLPSLSAGFRWNTNTLYSSGSVTVEAVQHTLTVTTPYGNSSPAAGTNVYSYGAGLSAVLTNSSVVNGTTQYVCTGWTGTGSAPASGSTTNTGSFSLTTNSAITWLWTTNYWLNTQAAAGGSVDVAAGWVAAGSELQVTATADPGYHFTGWTGNTAGDPGAVQMTLLMDHARSVTANFAADARNPLPFTETFEGIPAGESIFVSGNTNGWYNETNTTVTVVTNDSYTWSNMLYPVNSAAHTKVLNYSDAGLSIRFETNTVPENTTVDAMFSFSGHGLVSDTNLLSGRQTAACLDASGFLNVWYGLDSTGTNNAWQVYTGTMIAVSNWVRLTFEFDYTTDAANQDHYFRVRLNGKILYPATNGYSRGASSFSQSPSGEWLLTANPDFSHVQAINLNGYGQLDDVVVTTDAVTDFFVTYLLTGSVTGSGTVFPGSTNVISGGSAEFTVTASNYYRIVSLAANGTPVEGMTFDNNSTATNFVWQNVQSTGVVVAVFTEQVASDPAATPHGWLAQHGLTNFNADAAADVDGDGLLTWQEYIAGTNPTNLSSGFRVTEKSQNVLGWNTVSGRVYSIYWTTNLISGFQCLESNIPWTQSDYTNAFVEPAGFYKLEVRLQ